MTARRALWALYWAAVLSIAAGGASFVGIACAPHPGGAR